MKYPALALAAVLAFSFGPMAAAQKSAPMPEGVFYMKQNPDQYLAKDLLLNAKVVGASGKIIGDVEDLILNEYNQVVGVIMGVGGFLGVGEKRVGVRYSALRYTNKGGKTVVSLPNITRDVLKAMPAYKRAQPPKSFLEKVTERAKELAAKSGATAKDAYEKAKVKADKAYEKAKEGVKEAYDKAKDAAQPKGNNN